MDIKQIIANDPTAAKLAAFFDAYNESKKDCGCHGGSGASEYDTVSPYKNREHVSSQMVRPSNTPKSNKITIEVHNTTAAAKDVILFDCNGGVQFEKNAPAIPAGVQVKGLKKDYQVLKNQISSRATLKISRTGFFLPETTTSTVQFRHEVELYASNPTDDSIHKTVTLDPQYNLSPNQHHQNQVSDNTTYFIDPDTALCLTIEPNTKLHITFYLEEIIGNDR